MKILLTGSTGQLGRALLISAPKNIENNPVQVFETTRSSLDLSNSKACFTAVEDYRPDWIINAAAFTSVEDAERNPDLAFAVNAEAPKVFSEGLLKFGGKLLHLSTDFVFDGQKCFPYSPSDERNPLNTYGKSKAAGEQAIENLLHPFQKATILRTSWLMGPIGKNFLLTMLKLHEERNEISVVADEIGCPTSTYTLANVCWKLLELQHSKNKNSLKYLHWSDSGITTWYDVALKIGELAQDLGLISQMARVIPIKSIDYPSLVKRPRYSVLNSENTINQLSLKNVHWHLTIENILKSLT